MAPSPEAMDVDDEEYKSSEDEDFDPTTLNEDENLSSDAASEVEGPPLPRVRKRGRPPKVKPKPKKAPEAEDLGFENSGDEITIKQGAQAESASKKKRGKNGKEEDSGGEGGFVKTRSMRAIAEKEEKKKPVQVYAEATIDIEALWDAMNHDTPSQPFSSPPAGSQPHTSIVATAAEPSSQPDALPPANEEMIAITQTYTFAGQTTTETSLVPKSSAQARLYLQSQSQSQAQAPSSPAPPSPLERRGPDGQLLYAPLRRRSKWDPNPQGLVRGVALEKLAFAPRTDAAAAAAAGAAGRAPKLNVVDKSKLDWAKLVDREGTRDELDAAAKAKNAYHGRVEFLDRVEDKREEELRNVRKR